VVTHPRSAGHVRSAGRLTVPLAVPPQDGRAPPAHPPETAGRHNRTRARPLYQPRAAVVEVNFDGTPWQVNRQPVALVREEWRVVDRWWTEEPVSRRYFDVVLQSGENAVVFRDEERGCWFTQRGA
jgi:hypothetical protein